MCLQYKPTVVACFCIHLACKWSNWEVSRKTLLLIVRITSLFFSPQIPQSNEGKHWFWYVDKTVTIELLQHLTTDFLQIFDKCPSRLKRKIMSISANQSPNMNHTSSLTNSPFVSAPQQFEGKQMKILAFYHCRKLNLAKSSLPPTPKVRFLIVFITIVSQTIKKQYRYCPSLSTIFKIKKIMTGQTGTTNPIRTIREAMATSNKCPQRIKIYQLLPRRLV